MRAFWRGWKKLQFPAERRTEVFDTALRSGIPLWGEREYGGFVEVRAESGDADSLAETLRERGIEAGLSESRGLPALLRFLRNRPGLAAGAVLTAVWMTAASGLVWDVRIEGNESVPDEAVLAQLEELGFGSMPVCMAKTQYSFSDDPKKLGAPKDFTVQVRNLKVSAGAGFIVALTGEIMTMPGLPKVPAAERIDVDETGKISGLF